MKKSAKLLSLAIALLAGFGTTAHAEEANKGGLKLGADVVTSYVWRGVELSDAPAIQPSVSYTIPDIGIVVGAWGTSGIAGNTSSAIGTTRYQETDLHVTVPVGPVNVTVTDYYVPASGATTKAYNFDKDGPNTIEVSAAYEYEDLNLLGAIFVAGNTYDSAKYFEAGYKFYKQDKYTAKAVIGAGNKSQYSVLHNNETGFALVNVGCTVTKESYSVSYIYNPADQKANLVFSASF